MDRTRTEGGASRALHAADVVDLRSDTVTQPTEAMYERMLRAPLGDDGLDGDPTARDLESTAAAILGKEAALFVASCTMANLLATLCQVRRFEQVVLEAESHMFNSERGGATLTGAFHVPVAGIDGAMDLNLLEEALANRSARLKTSLVTLETSHNNAGGTVLPLAHMRAVRQIARDRGIAVHLDGARLFNASVYLSVPAAEITQWCDTVSLCLSKGLSAPVGAILAGERSVMDRARAIRRMLGGQQRQVGVVAAAGLEAMTTMVTRLREDHARAAMLSRALGELRSPVQVTAPQTNIIQVDVSRTGRTADEWVKELAGKGLLVRPWARERLRCVTHRHISDDSVKFAANAFGAAAAALGVLS